MNKLPALQFYPGDWRKDPGVQALSYHDRGVWFEILMLMHESEPRGKLMLNGSKMPESALARLLGLDNQNLTTTLTTLFDYGVASRCEDTGAIICRRMVRDEQLRQIRIKAGKTGGNPVLLKQNRTTRVKQKSTTGVKQNRTTHLKQKSTPSSSSSDEDVIEISDEPQGIPVDQFSQFWNACPRKVSKGQAEQAWKKAIKIHPADKIIAAAKLYAESVAGKDREYIKHPSTWLNGKCWEDELSPPVPNICRWPYDDTDINTPEGMALLTRTFQEGLHSA